MSNWLLLFNLVWTLCFGWWMACLAAFGAVTCLLMAAAPSGCEYGRVLWGLAGYLFYTFGKFVWLEMDEAYLHEDADEGRSISEYEQWQSGDLEYGRFFFGPNRHHLHRRPLAAEHRLGAERDGQPAEPQRPPRRDG